MNENPVKLEEILLPENIIDTVCANKLAVIQHPKEEGMLAVIMIADDDDILGWFPISKEKLEELVKTV